MLISLVLSRTAESRLRRITPAFAVQLAVPEASKAHFRFPPGSDLGATFSEAVPDRANDNHKRNRT